MISYDINMLQRNLQKYKDIFAKNPNDKTAKHLIQAYQDQIRIELEKNKTETVHGMKSITTIMK